MATDRSESAAITPPSPTEASEAGQSAGLSTQTAAYAQRSGDQNSRTWRDLKDTNKGREDDDYDSEKPVTGMFQSKGIQGFMETASREFTAEQLYQIYLLKLRRDREDLEPTKNDQAPRMVRSMVDLIRSIEERLQNLEDKPHNTSSPSVIPTAVAKNEEPDLNEVEVRFYNAADRSNEWPTTEERRDPWKLKGTFESEVDASHCIRVLFRWNAHKGTGMATKSFPSCPIQAPNPEFVDIEEIRIHSEPIASFLESLFKCELQKENVVLFRKPFRYLIRNAKAIKEHCGKLREKHPGNITAGESPKPRSRNASETHAEPRPMAGMSGSQEAPFDRPDALQQFELLTGFIDTYLKKQLDLFEEYFSGHRTSVLFENLWMLFDTDELIYCPSKTGDCRIQNAGARVPYRTIKREGPNAYRVLSCIGGIPKITPDVAQQEQQEQQQQQQPPQGDQSMVLQPEESVPTKPEVEERSQLTSTVGMRERYTSLCIDGFCLGFDGSKLMAALDGFEFKPFKGEVEIVSLEAYPMRYRPGVNGSPRGSFDDLVQRGAKFMDLSTISHKTYKGQTVGDEKEEIYGPVIIDFKLAFETKTGWLFQMYGIYSPILYLHEYKLEPKEVAEIPRRFCKHKACHSPKCAIQDAYRAHQHDRCLKAMRSIVNHLDEHDLGPLKSGEVVNQFKKNLQQHDLLALLPGIVPAYSLRNRKWVQLDINGVGEVDQEDGWSDLVLPRGHKKLIQAMVAMHSIPEGDQRSPNKAEVDLVPGKGKGCIILLHGAPGVGKTSTAECVAAFTKRALYPITCGDIGTELDEVEDKLDDHLYLAHKWGCVLLLDEADVFLAKRNKENLKRNGLVSIFLRTLEYYPGILFLTTNRVGAIDDAFRSRIHLTLPYPPLDKDRSLRVWQNNIKRLTKSNQERRDRGFNEIKIDRKGILNFADQRFEVLQWNGRQIRNAFQTCLALAEFEAQKTSGEGPRLTKRHFIKIARTTSHFNNYLAKVHGMDEEKQARRNRERAEFVWDDLDDDESDSPAPPEDDDLQSNESDKVQSEESSDEWSHDSDSSHKKSRKARDGAKRRGGSKQSSEKHRNGSNKTSRH